MPIGSCSTANHRGHCRRASLRHTLSTMPRAKHRKSVVMNASRKKRLRAGNGHAGNNGDRFMAVRFSIHVPVAMAFGSCSEKSLTGYLLIPQAMTAHPPQYIACYRLGERRNTLKPETIEKRRKAIDPYRRKGHFTLWVPFAPGEMMFVKDCPICHKPGVWTGIGTFACQDCRHLYP